MSIYINPSIQAFEEAVNSDIYVDKTEMILDINNVMGTKQKYISVSRPRRFGKTMAADMLCAYYGKNKKAKSLFKQRKIAKNSPDEWDAVFRIRKDDVEGQKVYLDFLRDLLKDRVYLALAYMTGILPIKKYGEHSALNMFDEYSMISPMALAKYTGFTVEEVDELCEKYHMDKDSVKEWYDGYIVSENIPLDKRELFRQGKYDDYLIQIFGPLSVVKAMRSGVIGNYWNNTETYEALADYIRMDYVRRFGHYKGNIIAVGINYDGTVKNTNKDFKKHSCLIRKF